MWGFMVLVLLWLIWRNARNSKITHITVQANKKKEKEMERLLRKHWQLFEDILNYEISYDELRERAYLYQDEIGDIYDIR